MNDAALEHALQQCSLHALLMLTSKALTRSGFGDVQILDRRQSKQKSRYGGHELLCETTVGTLPAKVIVKVIRDVPRTRMFDELAGGVLRNRADIGLLVTPFNTSQKLAPTQATYGPVRLELIDGGVLANLMRCSGIGVRGKGGVDYRFFAELELVSEALIDFIRKEKRPWTTE